MNPSLARAEIAAAARWWRDLIVRLQSESIPKQGLFGMLPENVPIDTARADAFESALVAEIEATFAQDLVTWDESCPLSGASMRLLEVRGRFPPAEVVRAAAVAGISHALRHLPDGAATAIHPGRLLTFTGRKDGDRMETIEVISETRGVTS